MTNGRGTHCPSGGRRDGTLDAAAFRRAIALLLGIAGSVQALTCGNFGCRCLVPGL